MLYKMSAKRHVCLFILSVIVCQGIIGVFAGDFDESNSLLRRKRVINLEPDEDWPVPKEDAQYVVNIREFRNNASLCVGTILSRHTVITAASCVAHHLVQNIKILAGSTYSYRGSSHNVIEKKIQIGNHQDARWYGVALLIVEPAFIYNATIESIDLHVGPLFPGTPATIFGWGCNPKAPRGTDYRCRLRSITIPIMRHQDCVNIYRNRAVISDKHICTYDANKRCGHTDVGAPLVVDNLLAGIYLLRGTAPALINPDIFLIIQDVEYARWIRTNTV